MFKRLLPYLPYVVCLMLLNYSCRVHKEITKTEYKTDSTAIMERDSVIRVKRLDSAAYMNTIRTLQESGVVFETEGVTPLSEIDTNSVLYKVWKENPQLNRLSYYPPNSIEFYPDGTLKKAEGRIKSALSKSDKSQQEAKHWKQSYDSLYQVKSKDSVTVKKEIKTVDKYIKKTVFPWYFWLFLILAGGGGWWVHRKFGKRKTVYL